MKKLSITFATIFTLLAISAPSLAFAAAPPASPAAPATPAATSPKDAVCEGVGLTTGGNGCNDVAGAPSVDSTLKVAINTFSLVVGVAAVIMIIIGGFKYITSAGDSARVSSAKDTILYAIVGLVVVAMSQLIVKFVLKQVTKPPPTPASSSSQTVGGKVGGQIK